MDIPGILQRFADNTITSAEREAFAGWLQTLSLQAYESVMLEYEAMSATASSPGDPDPRLFDRILDEISVFQRLEWERGDQLPEDTGDSGDTGDTGDTAENPAGPPHRSPRRFIGWIAAAAACILLLAGVWLLSPHAREAVPPEPATVAGPIGPGGNRAVLTLSNGSRLILDSISNGRLASQGAGDVVKLADGKLQYHAGTSAAVLYNTLATPRGGQYQVQLADGTKVWLNAASDIRYPTTFTGKYREVELRGEAYFEVARDDSHPFRVKVGGTDNGMQVDVLGTSFDIRAYLDEGDRLAHATLLEGSVKVSQGEEARVLRPGQQANATDGGRITIRSDVDLESVMAWKNGKLVFSRGNVRELMQEISRWYNVDVRYTGEVPSGGFSGLIDRNVPLVSVLHALAAYGIRTRLENRTIIVL